MASTALIEQTVATPSGPGPRMSSPVRSISPIAAAVDPIAEGGEQIGRILEVQGRHQQILDADAAEEQFKSALHGSLAKAKTELPGNKWAQAVQNDGSELAQKIQSDPNNAHIAGYLGKRLPALLSVMTYEARDAGMVATAKQHADQYEIGQNQRATQVGANFVPGTLGDNDVAKAIRAKELSMQMAMWPNNPEARNQLTQTFEQRVIKERTQAIAINAPQQLDAYAKANNLPTEEKVSLRNMAIGAIEAPYHLATAHHEAQVADTEANLDKLATAHDPGIANAAYQAKLAGFIDTQKYENYTHSKWRDPYATSAPGLVESYLKDIDQNPNRYSAADIAAIPADEISPDDRRKVQAARADGESYAKKAVGGEYLRALDTVRHALTPNIVINKEAVAARVEAALTSLRAAKEEGQFQTTKDVQDFTKQVLATYTVGKPKKPVEHVVAPSAPPVKLPPAIAAKIAAEARASGWEPGE